MSQVRWPVFLDGVGFWARGLPDWASARACLNADGALPTDAPARPAPEILVAAERRRAPDSVLLALEVATQACRTAARAPADLPGIFTCTYGDLTITDYMCRTLVDTPTQLSPTRFHNSVHNAAAGYWSIASASQAATTALSAGSFSFGAGLLEAVLQLRAGAPAVLLVGYDIGSPPTLAQVARSEGLFGAALVLASAAGAQTVARLDLELDYHAAPAAPAAPFDSTALQPLYTSNAMARCLPLFAALARGGSGIGVCLAAGPELTLRMEISECPN